MRVIVARHWDGHLPGDELDLDVDDTALSVLVREGVVRLAVTDEASPEPARTSAYSGPNPTAQPYPGPTPGAATSPTAGASEGDPA